MTAPTIHATTVALGESGVLIRGASGAGKSALALALLADWHAKGRFSRLVADDRTALSAAHGRLIARAPSAIAGAMEVRGLGICAADALAAVRVDLVVDLLPAGEAPRYPDEDARNVTLEGIDVPLVTLPARTTKISAQSVTYLLAGDGLTARYIRRQRPPDNDPHEGRTRGGDR
ncbi:HPr kinase/phosphatase C-terminal domain-containing protein [Acuticoccus sp. M5D2P5]|uniref:HPr kinase/phosphorylase n=1 Tax=Acuticoccus kalidii TaxID=2910977 RepID=UPI001F27F389|nr:HPr kinase/phosphatase C-terminal domain-containing protein [Acuticoccus kalidii]MCF3933671.1 HPr kinase/phosphatase C-terminal domain-containing protein [Acuticoccus kalidii]